MCGSLCYLLLRAACLYCTIVSACSLSLILWLLSNPQIHLSPSTSEPLLPLLPHSISTSSLMLSSLLYYGLHQFTYLTSRPSVPTRTPPESCYMIVSLHQPFAILRHSTSLLLHLRSREGPTLTVPFFPPTAPANATTQLRLTLLLSPALMLRPISTHFHFHWYVTYLRLHSWPTSLRAMSSTL
jgi:hypothetical protein